jgi:hypothetical protein
MRRTVPLGSVCQSLLTPGYATYADHVVADRRLRELWVPYQACARHRRPAPDSHAVFIAAQFSSDQPTAPPSQNPRSPAGMVNGATALAKIDQGRSLKMTK